MTSESSTAVVRAGASPPASVSEGPLVVIQAHRGLFDLDLKSLWQYRELLYFLIWRDVKVRFKQTVIGAGWAILQPLLTMLIFTVVFSYFAKIPSGGIPYPIFSFTALLPWTYFSQALSVSGASLVSSSNLISKIYFPRLIIPIASTLSPLVDLGLNFIVLVGLMVWYRYTPIWAIVILPLFLLLAFATALAVSLWLSALMVRYRDIRYIIPFMVQFWLYASPVAYPLSVVPEKWLLLYSLNPMVSVIEGFRWALLGAAPPDFKLMSISATVVILLLLGGIVFFKRQEQSFADVI